MSEAIVKFESIPFMGQGIQVTTDEPHYVALKPLFEGIGMDWSAVYRQISNDEVLMTCIANLQCRYPSGTKTLICLPLNMIQGLFFKINAHLYKDKNPALYTIICEYQKECYNVLNQYFTQGIAVNYANMSRAELFRMLAEAEEDKERQQKLLQAKDDEIDSLNSNLYIQGEKINSLTEKKDKLVLENIHKETELQKARVFMPPYDQPEDTFPRRGSFVKKRKKKTVSQPCQQTQLPVPQPPPYTPNQTVVSNPNVTVKDVSNPF